MARKILPTFKGYTVDMQVQEFRKTRVGKETEFIRFLSPKGEKLFEELRQFSIEVLDNYDYK
jgi:hypothetical protein